MYLSKGIIPLNNNRTFKSGQHSHGPVSQLPLIGITIRTFICPVNERKTETFQLNCQKSFQVNHVKPGVHKMTINTLKILQQDVYSALDHFVDIRYFWCFATTTRPRRTHSEAMFSVTTCILIVVQYSL